MEGVKWRVGKALDPWIPKKGRYKPIGVSEERREMRVSDLIDLVTCQWKVEVVQSVLQAKGVSLVQAIPLSCSDVEDRWVCGITQPIRSIQSIHGTNRLL